MSRKAKESIEQIYSYREPMLVTERYAYYDWWLECYNVFPICPRCSMSFEYEYVNYCSHCGQKLKWTGYNKCKIRYAGNK